jgi:hypothetical protein
MSLRTLMVAGLLVLAGLAATPAVRAQQAPAQPPTPPDPAAISPAQIQRLFEAYTVLQAQDALQLSEAQYGRFVTRLKALQESRRRLQQTRNQILGEIRKLINPQTGSQDEVQLADRLKALREAEDRSAAELKKAYEGVDETLDVRQQARFRVFEDRMEQQKLELLMRARQNARTAARGRGKT